MNKIKILNERNPEDRKAVVAGLVKYNAQHIEPESWEEIELYNFWSIREFPRRTYSILS